MKKRNRKRTNNNRNDVAASIPIPGPEDVKDGRMLEPPLKDLLFRPLIYKSNSNRTIEFDHVLVPFLIKDGMLYVIQFMDGCGDLSVYLECLNVDTEKPSDTYKDAFDTMRSCLETEQMIGVPYYFDKLKKALEQYMYALQLFLKKGIIEEKAVLDIIEALGFNIDDMMRASQSVNASIMKDKARREAMRMESEARNSVNDIMTRAMLAMFAMDKNADTDNARGSATMKDDETSDEKDADNAQGS